MGRVEIMLSDKARSVLESIQGGAINCHQHNRQVLDKLRQNGFVRITIKRGTVPERFCRITPEGLRFLAGDL